MKADFEGMKQSLEKRLNKINKIVQNKDWENFQECDLDQLEEEDKDEILGVFQRMMHLLVGFTCLVDKTKDEGGK